MATIYARLINQYMCKYHILFSASFYKIDEEYQRSNEIEKFSTLKINNSLTESFFDNIEVISQLEHQNQIQEIKESARTLDKTNSVKIKFLKLVR